MLKNYSWLFMLFSLAMVAAPLSAEIYKCVDADGKTSFRDTLCDGDAETLEKVERSSSDNKGTAKTQQSSSSASKKRSGLGGFIDRARKVGEGNN